MLNSKGSDVARTPFPKKHCLTNIWDLFDEAASPEIKDITLKIVVKSDDGLLREQQINISNAHLVRPQLLFYRNVAF